MKTIFILKKHNGFRFDYVVHWILQEEYYIQYMYAL